MALLRIPLLVLFILGIGTFGSSAQEPLPSLKQIIDRGEIRVAIIEDDFPPMIMTDKKKNLSGFDISLARVIGKELGTKVVFERVPSFNAVIDHVAAKKADIGLSLLSRMPARALIVRFTRSYIVQTNTVLINRVRGLRFRQTCPSLEDMIQLAKKPGQLGVVADSSHENRVNRVVKDHKIKKFDTFDEMMQAVVGGKVLVTMQGEVAARYFLHTNPFAYIRLKLCEFKEYPDYIGIAVRPDAPDLVEWLNVVLDRYNIRFDADVLIDKDPEKIIP